MKAHERIVFPLDVPTLEEARRYIRLLEGHVGVFKIGLELFVAHGPAALELVHSVGARSFLDLKLHDIPETMARAVKAALKQKPTYLTIHASSGPEALRRAATVAQGTSTTLLAVTVLTSLEEPDLQALGIQDTPSEAVVRWATLASAQGIHGFVSSSHECSSLRKALPKQTLLVVPGVRPLGSSPGDQKRVQTPAAALEAGADLLVIGRPIRDAKDPVAAAHTIAQEIQLALQ